MDKGAWTEKQGWVRVRPIARFPIWVSLKALLLKERREYDENGLFDWKQIFKNGVLQEEPIIRI